jgi:hypothetical protein
MALVLKDRVKETTTTVGTGTLSLLGASVGYQSFSVIGNGNTCYYAISSPTGNEWEVGIGTYTSSGSTLSRDTILSSSNSGSVVSLSAGTKDVYVVYPAEKAVYEDSSNKVVQSDFVNLDVSGTATLATATITAGTVSTTPTNSTDIANKQYVDTLVSSGITYHQPVKYEVPSINLNATYNNGASGVGATLTNAGTLVAFAPDGPTASQFDRILVYNQTNAYENGVYEVTTVGSGAVAWVLTRTTDADSYGLKDVNALGNGDAFFVQAGNTGAGETYVCNTSGVITFGTTAITFAQISDSKVYSAGTGLTLSGTQFSITPVGTASTYGSASQVPVLTTNASGQITSVTNTSIDINANQITSGTLLAVRGGTGQGSYAVGDLLYADTTTTLAKLSDVATGNVLLSGGTNTAPLYGKVGLGTHISGVLAVSNGGTGLSTLTANGVLYASTTSAFSQSANLTFDGTTLTTGGLSDSGNLTFTGTGNRITGDFSNATQSNRVAFQTSTTNGNTSVGVIPNGTATGTNVSVFGGTDATNAAFLRIRTDNTTTFLEADKNGTGTYLPLTMYTGGSERLRIDTSGNVGIGTNSPDTKLQISGTSGSTQFRAGTDTNGFFEVNAFDSNPVYCMVGGTNATAGVFGTQSNIPTIFFTNNTERMRIDSSGNVGIGTVSPAGKFDVTIGAYSRFYVANSLYDGVVIGRRVADDAFATLTFVAGGASNPKIEASGTTLDFYTNNSPRMRITTNGGLSFGTSGTNYGVQNAALISNGDAIPSYSQVASLGSFFYQTAFMGGF